MDTNITQKCSQNRQPHPVLDARSDITDIGVRFRQSRDGPEDQLISLFLQKFNVRVPKGSQITFFKEPRLESGSPDLVGVIWHPPTTNKWNEARLSVRQSDIRLMHYLAKAGPSERSSLKTLFGSWLDDALGRLEAAEMIRISRRVVSPFALSRLYAARHIFAIEAKMANWSGALAQAFLNRWFATSSYILMPRLPTSGRMISNAESCGVGVWSFDHGTFALDRRTEDRTPISYGSWLFNEWAWRASISSRPHYATP